MAFFIPFGIIGAGVDVGSSVLTTSAGPGISPGAGLSAVAVAVPIVGLDVDDGFGIGAVGSTGVTGVSTPDTAAAGDSVVAGPKSERESFVFLLINALSFFTTARLVAYPI